MQQQTTLKNQLIIYLSTALLFLISNQINAQVFYTEDFETNGNGIRYFPDIEAIDASNDYFSRTDGSTISANGGLDYSGQSGNFYWAGEDHDDGGVGGSGNSELELEIRDIDITGKINLTFSALFGGHNQSSGIYESGEDYLIIEYRIDNGTWNSGLSFQSDPNKYLAPDTTGNGIGDGPILEMNMKSYEFAISGTGNELDIRLRGASRSSSEEWAIDLIQISENSTLSNVDEVFVENDINVYSINNSGFYQVSTSNDLKLESIEVFDLTGKKVGFITVENNSNSNIIDLSFLQSSIYILKINSNRGSFSKKIIRK